MVTPLRPIVIEPERKCTACSRAFQRGDKALCLVKVPTGEHDTLCVSCWALILASSIVGLKGNHDLDAKGLRRLFLDALDVLDELKGTESHVHLN